MTGTAGSLRLGVCRDRPGPGTTAPEAVPAHNAALNQVIEEIVRWTVQRVALWLDDIKAEAGTGDPLAIPRSIKESPMTDLLRHNVNLINGEWVPADSGRRSMSSIPPMVR